MSLFQGNFWVITYNMAGQTNLACAKTSNMKIMNIINFFDLNSYTSLRIPTNWIESMSSGALSIRIFIESRTIGQVVIITSTANTIVQIGSAII